MKKLAELRQRKAALVKEGLALLDNVNPAVGMSDETQAQVEANRVAVEAINAAISARESLLGEQADNPAPTPRVEGMRDLEAERPFASFGEQLQAIASASRPNGPVDKRLLHINATAGTGSNEGVDSEGAFLVQADYARDLSTMDSDNNVLLSRCTQRTISTEANSVVIAGIDESSRADGSRYGGVRVYTKSELEQYTGSRPKFKEIKIELEKLTGLYFASDEILQDAAFLGAEVSDLFRQEFAFKIQDLIVNGTGADGWLGLLTSPCGISVAKETDQAAKSVLFENISKMWARMPAALRNQAIWTINQDAEPALDQMYLAVGTGGVPVYMPAGGVADAPYGRLKGRPVIPIEQAPTVGTVGDIMLLALSQFVVVAKGTIQEAMSIHLKFDYGQTTFRWTYRVGGKPRWASAITPYKGSNTLSPIIKLATRA